MARRNCGVEQVLSPTDPLTCLGEGTLMLYLAIKLSF